MTKPSEETRYVGKCVFALIFHIKSHILRVSETNFTMLSLAERMMDLRLSKALYKEYQKLLKQEQSWLRKPDKQSNLKEKLYEKVPKGLSQTLESAFAQAFSLIFLKGSKLLEKTFQKEQMDLHYKAADEYVENKQSKKSMKILEKTQKKENFINHTATTVTGFGLGVLGMGLPDIPLLVSTILRGIYEVATSYGYAYDTVDEQIYILRMIKAALVPKAERKQAYEEVVAACNVCIGREDVICYPVEEEEEKVEPESETDNTSDNLLEKELVTEGGNAGEELLEEKKLAAEEDHTGDKLLDEVEPAAEKEITELEEAFESKEQLRKREITKTSKALSDALLVEKFVQGIPVVGAVGGFVNHSVYRKILSFVKIQYKKRYILLKAKQ